MLTRGWPLQLAICIVLGASAVPAAIGLSPSAGAAALFTKSQGCIVPRAALPPSAASAPEAGAPRAWTYKVLVKKAYAQVVDPATGLAYGLASETADGEGPDLLQAFSLSSGHVREGPTIGFGSGYSETLSLADGSLWVGGSIGKGDEPPGPELCQVDPATLHLVRQVSLPAPKPSNSVGLPLLVSPGPTHTLWIGYGSELVHVDARSGAIVSTDTIASGFIVSLATDPANHLLYVSVSYSTIDGKMVPAAVEERLAMNGQLLFTTSATSPVTGAVAGGTLTALPDGVATSFRTGMMGLTELLAASGLTAITPPGLGTSYRDIDKPPGDVFSWPMGASTLYTAGSLWIENQWGVLACVNPATGAIFSSEQPHQLNAIYMVLLGTRQASHQLLAAFGNEVISITAPRVCWH
jgi:hypothetical protein